MEIRKEVEVENINELINILNSGLSDISQSIYIAESHIKNFEELKKSLTEEEILSIDYCDKDSDDLFYWEIINENKLYEEYPAKRYPAFERSELDQYDVFMEFIKYFPNLNIYIKLTHYNFLREFVWRFDEDLKNDEAYIQEWKEYKENLEYSLVNPILKLKVDYK